ncbi:MAG: hypothetical protein GEU82_19020, partial [Luteitalea sp.]|nr:hypothetical protein [Luteitalea sp.]
MSRSHAGILVVACTLIAATLPLPAQTQGQPAPPKPGEGGPTISTLRRAGPAKGPTPRLPDGTVDLSGVWVGGGPINDLERDGGLKPGEVDSLLLPWAKELMAKRDVTMEPHNQCLPMGVPRVT